MYFWIWWGIVAIMLVIAFIIQREELYDSAAFWGLFAAFTIWFASGLAVAVT